MMASTRSLDLCFIFTTIHHAAVITTVRKTRISSRTVWADPARVCNSWYVQHPRGPFFFFFFYAVCSHVVETSNGLRLKLESLSFCCALSSLTEEGTGGLMCLLKACCFVNTEASALTLWKLSASGWRRGEGRVGHCTLVKKRRRERETDRGREGEREATVGGGGCQLVWPAPGARGECSVQQTAW